MNGRLYDPVLGRVLSPDNYVQNAYGTQDYNRYTYAHNNPLLYNDPDGNNPLLISTIIGAFIGGTVNGLKYALRGDDFIQGFWRGAITGAIAGLTGYYAPIGFVGGAVYGAGTGAAIGAISAGLNGGNIWRGAGLGSLTGAIMGGISGGIESVLLGGELFSGYRGGTQYTLADGNIINGTTPAEYSDEYLYKLKESTFKDVKGVKSMNAGSDEFVMDNGYFKTNEGPALGATVKSIAAHGRMSHVYFAKAAFSSREQLAFVMAHEFGHVKFNLLHLNEAANAAISSQFTDSEGHLAIYYMQNDLIDINKWNKILPYRALGFEPPLPQYFNLSKNLARSIKFPK